MERGKSFCQRKNNAKTKVVKLSSSKLSACGKLFEKGKPSSDMAMIANNPKVNAFRLPKAYFNDSQPWPAIQQAANRTITMPVALKSFWSIEKGAIRHRTTKK